MQAGGQPSQLRLEVQQDGGGHRQHHRNRCVAQPYGYPQAVTHHQGRHRGCAWIGWIRVAQVGRDDHQADNAHADCKWHDALQVLAEQAGQRPQHGDQAKGAQTGAGGGYALAFQADQQADADGDQEGFDLLRVERDGAWHA
ncbi:hypothetical protein SDC9_173590 [bioreactor metagenome]|uniref:Uncharacterized protein n=1 Tax=bioreactor metagenome TaxID=1076179 RepID=A0A645GIV6_9ZZZZ